MSKRNFGILLAFILVAGATLPGCSSIGIKPEEQATTTSVSKTGTGVGDAAPDFRLTKMDGSDISLGDLRGRPVVLIFWTAWCPVCKEEAPHFNALAERYGPRGVQVLGINIKDSMARTESGIEEFGIRYAVARDADASLARRYRVTGTPTVIILDRNGVVHYFGNELPADYNARLDSLLEKAV